MAWINPKTTWKATDYVQYSDFNRIKNNLNHIQGMAATLFGSFGYTNMGGDRTTSSYCYASDFNDIENNLYSINHNSYRLDIGTKKTFSNNGYTIDYVELNRIESACLQLYNKLTSQTANNTAPTISITSNTTDWTNSATYTVTGKILANGNGIGGKQVYYTEGGVEKTKAITLQSDGTFSITVPLATGSNEIIIRARDASGNLAVAKFIKQRETTTPTLTIVAPTSSSSTNPSVATSTSYTAHGTVSDKGGSGIKKVTVNGNNATISNGEWRYTLTGLKRGELNTVHVEAIDNAGNRTTTTRYMMLDATAPSLAITSASGYVWSQTYALTGTVSDAHSGVASVKINNVAVAVSNGQFSKNFTLGVGTTTFTIVATDNAGNSNTITHSVTFDNTAHGATLSTSLIVPTYRHADAGGSGGRGASVGREWITDFYAERGASNLMDGTGASVWAKAWFNANINLTVLPNYSSIKRIVIGRYGYGSQTIEVNGATATSFEDYDASSGTEYQMGHEISRSAKAGISSLTYYYA